MDEDWSEKIVANAQKSAAHGESYDEMWRKVGKIDALAGYAKIRTDFIDYVMRKYIQPQAKLRILDLGCGAGWLTAYLARYGEATGVDFAAEAIAAAQETYGTQAHYVVADAASPTLGLSDDSKFDLIVSSEVVEHVEDHQAYVHQAAAFLKPGGWLVLTTPNRRFWDDYQKDTERFQEWGQPIENWLTLDECRALLENAGFEILWREGWPDVVGYTFLNRLADNPYLRKATRVVGVYHEYARLILPFCLFQMNLAQKKTK